MLGFDDTSVTIKPVALGYSLKFRSAARDDLWACLPVTGRLEPRPDIFASEADIAEIARRLDKAEAS